MSDAVKILIVEDEMIIGANISLQLTRLGYEVTGILPRGEEALPHVRENQPDLVLLDIQLKGEIDGIETARRLKEEFDIPIIFLTANADEAHFNRAKATRPEAFISKPFKKLDLQRAIEITLSRLAGEKEGVDSVPDSEADPSFVLEDRIFVRHKDKMVRVFLRDIQYIEADRNYSRIITSKKEYLLAVSLKVLEEKLTDPNFLRIHRSFVINLSQIDELAENHVVLANKAIPVSQSLRSQLLDRIQRI